jgi:hypothetical protein
VVFDASSRYLINEPGVEISVDRNGIAGPGVSPQYNCAWLPSLNNRVQRNLLPYDIDSIHVVMLQDGVEVRPASSSLKISAVIGWIKEDGEVEPSMLNVSILHRENLHRLGPMYKIIGGR